VSNKEVENDVGSSILLKKLMIIGLIGKVTKRGGAPEVI
jgi:hypothetical protein